MAYFAIRSRYYPGMPEETHYKAQDGWYASRELNQMPPTYSVLGGGGNITLILLERVYQST
jgi:hypothetical protein